MDSFTAHSASFIYRSGSGDHELETTRKKMRKGTKSCVECRRRKIRCTFSAVRPDRCNECFSRGFRCIDQEHAPVRSSKSQYQGTEQVYSLRERVAILENTLDTVLKKLDKVDGKRMDSISPGTPVTISADSALTLSEPVESESNGHTEQAPLLTLLDNHVVSRSHPHVEPRDQSYSGNQPSSNAALKSVLLSLLPPCRDIEAILKAFPLQYHTLETRYPEIQNENLPKSLSNWRRCSKSETLGEIAKLLLFLVSTIDQLPASFDFRGLQAPFQPKDFVDRVLSVMNHVITSNEDISSTLPGIECFFFAAKYYMNSGQPRKAWRLYRRGIEFAQLRGFHLSTSRPIDQKDILALRQSYIWCSLSCCERYFSLILGLPYMVPDRFLLPNFLILVETGYMRPSEEYVYKLCCFASRIIDRNQDAHELSVSKTLAIDRELETLRHNFSLKGSDIVSGESHDEFLLSHFMHYFIRAMLHLPFALKSGGDSESQYCYNAALQSSRNCIEFYRRIRQTSRFHYAVCKMIDFQMFTAAMVLAIHLLSRSDLVGTGNLTEIMEDRRLLHEAIYIFREISVNPGGSVAAQSANVLEMLYGFSQPGQQRRNHDRDGCKITIPYFGSLYLRLGRNFEQMTKSSDAGDTQPSFPNPISNTPLFFKPPFTPIISEAGQNQNPASLLDGTVVALENILALPNTDFDYNRISGLEAGSSGIDPSLHLDLCLDQGWNLDWVRTNDFPTPPPIE
ncbi:hypothetical protein LOZ52_001207 [Ophidiomyces ophidiicola]|uniref:Uncharacterized protein n=1 Tax=Ophidiomyces ophidiicola TaxID=1387563 RepID=A0ACB8V678_9EURO|nr:hypothetical protein LOZ64_001140 [Ophidiomyces ophidiicola]KAI2010458.1 hypothetical protein LOZ49_003481 [Ophidiomyces ophidiicola]KAI2025777.1 hypothetical protein LOZ46_000711 [Ophidiomyces ophidiicola]KAI2059733.1 hypothetical protein LOZ44_000416 [Ophidiomyces ophidiicola]KAI2131983.1 hypothetical protein LOZ31_000350 [Ophidiomyces ophidiicola]